MNKKPKSHFYTRIEAGAVTRARSKSTKPEPTEKGPAPQHCPVTFQISEKKFKKKVEKHLIPQKRPLLPSWQLARF